MGKQSGASTSKIGRIDRRHRECSSAGFWPCSGAGLASRCSIGDGVGGVTRLMAAIVLLALLPGWTDTRGIVRVDRASPEEPYDFVVHVRNIADIKYNPLVRADRNRMALDLVRGECPGARVVGEDRVITEIWGLTSSLPDYVVLVSCAGKGRKVSRSANQPSRF